MCNKSWQTELLQTLNNLWQPGEATRVALVGIGSELRGDDIAGVWLARELLRSAPAQPHLLVLDAGLAPENFTGSLRAFAPHLVILADAAEMQAEPGMIRLIDWRNTAGISASTHTLPLHLLAAYLQAELGCQITLLGFQIGQATFDQPMSAAMHSSLQFATTELVKILDHSQTV